MKTAIQLIDEERARQVVVEGYTAKHDDAHARGELTDAGSHRRSEGTSMTAIFQFKLRRRVFRYRGKFRWIITDATQAYGTVMAHGVERTTKAARAQAGIKIIEITRSHETTKEL